MRIRRLLAVLTVVAVLAGVGMAAGRARGQGQGPARQNRTAGPAGSSFQAPCGNTGMGARWGGQGFSQGRMGARGNGNCFGKGGGRGDGNGWGNGGMCQGGGGQQVRQRLRDGSCGQTCPVQR